MDFINMYEMPPPPPRGHLDWDTVPVEMKENDPELQSWLARNSHICDNPKSLIDLSFAEVMHEMGIYTPPTGPPKMGIWTKIKSIFRFTLLGD